MTEPEYLYACVEAGVALSGFAALAVAFRSRGQQEHSAYERTLVANMIERGLVAALFALAPMLVGSFVSTDRAAWSVCSAAIALYSATVVTRSAIAWKNEPEAIPMVGRRTFVVLMVLAAVFASLRRFSLSTESAER